MRRFDEGPSGPFEPPVPGGGVPPPRHSLPIAGRRVSVCRPAGHPSPSPSLNGGAGRLPRGGRPTLEPGPRIWWTAALALGIVIWAAAAWAGWLPLVAAAAVLVAGWSIYCGVRAR
jgi:hypothetical protein